MYTCPCAHPVWHVTRSERRAARAQTAVLRSTRLYVARDKSTRDPTSSNVAASRANEPRDPNVYVIPVFLRNTNQEFANHTNPRPINPKSYIHAQYRSHGDSGRRGGSGGEGGRGPRMCGAFSRASGGWWFLARLSARLVVFRGKAANPSGELQGGRRTPARRAST